GVELAAELTRRDPDLKVLYCSGYTDSALVSRGALIEGVDLLSKPFSPAALVQRVRETLDRVSRTQPRE
ncbi:MAG: hybrid sensor histidine kinase/response regulator, partial [Planctomycetota bacterium]|nr:hybrid sensor histidine kinase/response regulator [Planctomycetota bacterium]